MKKQEFDLMQATSDECGSELHRLGYTFGDFTTAGPDGRVVTVFAHKGERKILTHAPTSVEAYRAAAREAVESNP